MRKKFNIYITVSIIKSRTDFIQKFCTANYLDLTCYLHTEGYMHDTWSLEVGQLFQVKGLAIMCTLIDFLYNNT